MSKTAVHEIRIAVGSPKDRRSTVWKFLIRNSEIYIFSRMFGSDLKVSLHSSGDCQWSATDSWVKKVLGRRNADRHFNRWSIPRPTGSATLHAFQIRIPETELRVIVNTENLKDIMWLPVPSKGHSVSLECYITPPSEHDPSPLSDLPCPLLFSLPLSDGRWFTVLHHVLYLDGKDLEPLRKQMNDHALTLGIITKPEHRACAFTVSDDTARGLIEMCTVAG